MEAGLVGFVPPRSSPAPRRLPSPRAQRRLYAALLLSLEPLGFRQTAIKALFLERVDIVATYEREVHSPTRAMKLPSVIALRQYVRPSEYPAFTRFNLFLRDRFQCQYCGELDELTFDHVVPRAQGGRTTWENVATACAPCNLRKVTAQLQARLRILPIPIGRPAGSCRSMAAASRPTTCTRAGATISTGTSSWRPQRGRSPSQPVAPAEPAEHRHAHGHAEEHHAPEASGVDIRNATRHSCRAGRDEGQQQEDEGDDRDVEGTLVGLLGAQIGDLLMQQGGALAHRLQLLGHAREAVRRLDDVQFVVFRQPVELQSGEGAQRVAVGRRSGDS